MHRLAGRLLATVLILSACALPAVAQSTAHSNGSSGVNPSSKQFHRFAKAVVKVQKLEGATIEKVNSMIGQSPLSRKEYFKIRGAILRGKAESGKLTSLRRKEYLQLSTRIHKAEAASEKQSVAAVKKTGLSVAAFNKMAGAVQKNPELMTRLKKLEKQQKK